MEIRVLGPLSVRAAGRELAPSAPKPRQLMTLLLLNDPHPVPVHRLLTELWDESPPRGVMTTLQTHVLQLRKQLAVGLGLASGTVARELLRYREGSYQLALRAHYFDLQEFHRHTARAYGRLRAGDRPGAAAAHVEALSHWRGPALVDVVQGRLLQAEAARLEVSRLAALSAVYATRLRSGPPRADLDQLARLVARHPLHHGLRVQYLTALYRSGHRAEALRGMARLRAAGGQHEDAEREFAETVRCSRRASE